MAGMSLRLARSPLAPKMTMAHEGAVGMVTRPFLPIPKGRRERHARLCRQSTESPARGVMRVAAMLNNLQDGAAVGEGEHRAREDPRRRNEPRMPQRKREAERQRCCRDG